LSFTVLAVDAKEELRGALPSTLSHVFWYLMEQMNNIAYDSPLFSSQLHAVSESVYLNTTVRP
jgi:hypothetical protein